MWRATFNSGDYVKRSQVRRDRLASAIRSALSTTAKLVADVAKTGAPSKTGKLRGSIKPGAVSGFRVLTRATARTANWMENGTKAHDIRPKRDSPLTGKLKGPPRLRFKINGSWVSKRVVKHPGTKALHFMQYARNVALLRLPAQITAVTRQLLSG